MVSKIFWALVPYIAGVGIIYGTWEYAQYYGWWKSIAVSVLMGAIGWMAVAWFGHQMPVVGYFLRKWEREANDTDNTRNQHPD